MSHSEQYVTFGVGEDLFAAPVARVREILELRRIACLPHAPPHLIGMIDLRSRPVPVIDLRGLLGLAKVADTLDTRLLVLQVPTTEGEVDLALKLDRVFEVTPLDQDALDPPPHIGGEAHARTVLGVGRRNGAFVSVLDLEHLFADTRLSHPSAAGFHPAATDDASAIAA